MAKAYSVSGALNILQESYQTLIGRGKTTKVFGWMDCGWPKVSISKYNYNIINHITYI